MRTSAEATEESLSRGFAPISTEFMIRELISTVLTKALVPAHYERPHDRVADCPSRIYTVPLHLWHTFLAPDGSMTSGLSGSAVYFSPCGLHSFHD